jgi:transposase
VPDAENRDLRQLLWHRHRLVQMRTRVMNQLHVVALNEGLRRKKALWRPAGRAQLASLVLAPWASRRRQDLLDLLDQLTPKIQELTRSLEQVVETRPIARRLQTHPGVGPLTALAFELVIGTPERFQCAKQIASYVGLVPSEESSGDRRRLGHISKQGNVLLRFLLVEAAQVTVRSQMQWRSQFFHLAMRRGRKIAKVAMARKLAVELYWMWPARMGLRKDAATRFARGRARKSPWCAVNHRRNDWASRSPFAGGVRRSNHDRGCDRRDGWVGLSA